MSTYIEEFDRIFTYHEPTEEQIKSYKVIREKAKELVLMMYELAPACREKSLAFTKVEESVMWVNAAIARWSDLENASKDK